jgi:hypothetical protein
MGWKGRRRAIKAVTNQIRQGKGIAKRAGQTPADNDVMRGSISDALNELGAVASEGAQALRAMIPNVAGEIKTVAEFISMARAMAEITSLTVSAWVDLFKVTPGPCPAPCTSRRRSGQYRCQA